MDKYPASDFLPNIVIHITLSISGKMADWGTRDPRWVLGFYRLVGSPCGFNIVSRLGPLHEAG